LPAPRVLWLYDPCAAPLIASCGERVALYDCVDDYAAIEGTDRATGELLEAMDAACASRARVVATTTRSLHERHRARNDATHLVRNAGDYAHFSAAVEPAIRDLPRPVIGFAGNLHPGKVDFELLGELAARRPEWTFLLVGPVQPAAAERVAALTHAPNVRHVGHVPYAQLPAYVAAFDVALIPYVANRYTRSCFPLKLYEYLAAGKPVVAAGLPELAGMEPDVALADGCDAFESAVVEALSSRDGVQRRMAVAAANTWEGRAATLLGLVDDALAAG
jgi:glycosyltransferase involved in cell wall biosynthesis